MTRKNTIKPQPVQKPTPAKTPSVLMLVSAIIASTLLAILLYVLYFIFMDYLETASPEAALLWIGIFLFAAILGPGILVAAIIYPKLKK